MRGLLGAAHTDRIALCRAQGQERAFNRTTVNIPIAAVCLLQAGGCQILRGCGKGRHFFGQRAYGARAIDTGAQTKQNGPDYTNSTLHDLSLLTGLSPIKAA